MYKCQHFEIRELVDRETYERFGSDTWMFFDPRILMSLDSVREYFNVPVTANNWHIGGPFSQRGLRSPDSIGAKFSLHRFGCAVDYDVKGMSSSDVRKIILENPNDPAFKLINCLEMDVNWVHMDCRNIAQRIRKVYP